MVFSYNIKGKEGNFWWFNGVKNVLLNVERDSDSARRDDNDCVAILNENLYEVSCNTRNDEMKGTRYSGIPLCQLSHLGKLTRYKIIVT